MNLFKIQVHLILLSLIIPNLGFATLIVKAPFYFILIVLSLYLTYKNSLLFNNIDKIHYAVFIYLLASLISVFHSVNGVYSMGEFLIYSSILIISFNIAHKCKSNYKLKYVIDTLGFYVCILVLVSLFYVYSENAWEFAAGKLRFKGLYLHPVSYGNLLLVGIIIYIGKFLRYNSLISAFLVLLLLFQLYLTGSRTPLIGLIVVIGYLYTKMKNINEIKDKTRILAKAVSIPMVLTIFLIIFLYNYEDIIYSFLTRDRGEELWALSGRVSMWIAAFQSLTENPYFGKGFGMAGKVIVEEGIYKNPVIIDNPGIGIGGVTHLHNAWLQAAVQTNILGIVAFTYLYMLTLKTIIKNIFTKNKMKISAYRSFIIPLFLLVIFLISFVGSVPSIGRDVLVFLFYFSLFISVNNNNNKIKTIYIKKLN